MSGLSLERKQAFDIEIRLSTGEGSETKLAEADG
jgi:hypothetical protein